MNLFPTEHRLTELERRVAILEKGTVDGEDKQTQTINLIKKIQVIARDNGCTLQQAAWALTQVSVPADQTSAGSPFPVAD